MSRSTPAFPFKTLPKGLLEFEEEGWTISAPGRTELLLRHQEPFRDWDAQLDFGMERHIVVSESIGMALWGVDATPHCELLVIGITGSTGARTVLTREVVPDELPATVKLSIRPTSSSLAGSLRLLTCLCLAVDLESRDDLAPTRSGSRLWEREEVFRLEGGTSRLALYQASLGSSKRAKHLERTAFHLEIRDDPYMEFESAVAVYLNSDNPAYLNALALGDRTAQHALWAGVIRRVLVSSAGGDWIAQDGEYEPHTLGGTVLRWAREICGCPNIRALSDHATNNFPIMDAQIDSWTRTVMDASEKAS